MDYASITTPPKVSRMGGSKQKMFLCPYDEITTLQTPTNGKITTAHVPVTNKGFIEVYVTADTGKFMNEVIGGRDRKSFQAKGEFYHPGESDEIVAFNNAVIHERFIILFPLPGSAACIQIGSAEFQATISGTYDTTTNAGDGRGILFSFECFMPELVKYTASTIPMKPVS